MNVLIVYAHPNPNSFNAAIRDRIMLSLEQAGHDLRLRDLYDMHFDPVLDTAMLKQELPERIVIEQNHLRWADDVVFIYPLWWYDRPAILKGWCDQVFSNGFAFSYATGTHEGTLPIRRVLIISTAGGSEEDLKKLGGDDMALDPFARGTLGFCGVMDVRKRLFHSVPASSDQEREEMLQQAAQDALALFGD